MNAVVQAVPNMMGPRSSVFAATDAAKGDLSGGITGGYAVMSYRGKVWTIRHRGVEQQLMRDDGDGPRGSIDVVILKANPHLSKIWYENGWQDGSNAPPDCSSTNGVTPEANSPKKQSALCATCPRNAWGTAPNGGKGKACADSRRMAVVPLPDIQNEALGGPILLRCPAASLQDLAAFDQKLSQLGYPYYSVGVKIAFDPAESFPKFVFTALRPLTDDEARMVIAHQQSDAVARVISEEAPPTPEQIALLTAPQPQDPTVAALAGNAASAAFQQPAQQPVTQPVTQQVAQPQPVQQAAPPPVQTGFGATAPVAPQPVQAVQQPAQQVAQQPVQQAAPPPVQPVQQADTNIPPKMTGFGPTTATAAPTQAPQQAAQQSFPGTVDGTVQPDVTAASVASLDERLAELLKQ